MKILKKAIIYYRDFPKQLESQILSDVNMSFVKDGSLMCEANGKRMPRMTIFIKSLKNEDTHNDKKRIKQLEQQLTYMIKTNQIISFLIV